jgi:hypothetical protein
VSAVKEDRSVAPVESNGTAPGPSIYELMPRLLAALRPVGKEGHNTQQNYRFRSVDGIYDAVHDAEAAVGVFHMPRILQRTVETLPTRGGGSQRLVTVEAVYTFYGPQGDSVVLGPVWGEGSDVGDKATSKAQTAALKYGLIHALCIPLEGDADADAHAVEFAQPPEADPEQWFRDNGWADGKFHHDAYRADSVALRNSLNAEARAQFRDWMEEHDHAFNRGNPRAEAEAIRKKLVELRDSETVVAPEDGQEVPVERPPDGPPLRREDLTPVPYPDDPNPEF